MGLTKDVFMLCKGMTTDEAEKITPQHRDYSRYTANIKFDGERIIAVVLNGDVILMNRNGKITNFNFREVVEDLKGLDDCIIDGEIISRDDDFTKLMTRARVSNPTKLAQREKDVPIKYMVFDVLKIGSEDLRTRDLMIRVKKLNELLEGKETDNLEIAEYGDIDVMFERAKLEDREGIIAKDICGKYESRRSEFWLKIKFFKETTFKAISYTQNPKGIRVEDSLGRSCQIAGQQHEEVKEILDSVGEVTINIQYLSQASNGNYRFPSYRGLVDDTLTPKPSDNQKPI